jgi:hypothetical protein
MQELTGKELERSVLKGAIAAAAAAAECQANELGIPNQIGFVPTQSLAQFSEEEVARWSPVAPPAAVYEAVPAPVVAAAAPSAGELAKLKGHELKEQLRKRGLRMSGRKEELVTRLLAGWSAACSFDQLLFFETGQTSSAAEGGGGQG